jgi:hypothetical protein
MTATFQHIAMEIRRIVFEWEEKLITLPQDVTIARLNRSGRNIKMIIGHLIDSASNNHQRMVRLQYTDHLVFPDYTRQNDMWISIQQYQEENWNEMVQLWKYYNLHIAHIILHADPGWLNNKWIDEHRDPVTLKDIIPNYLAHLTLHVKEIAALISPGVDTYQLPADTV